MAPSSSFSLPPPTAHSRPLGLARLRRVSRCGSRRTRRARRRVVPRTRVFSLRSLPHFALCAVVGAESVSLDAVHCRRSFVRTFCSLTAAGQTPGSPVDRKVRRPSLVAPPANRRGDNDDASRRAPRIDRPRAWRPTGGDGGFFVAAALERPSRSLRSAALDVAAPPPSSRAATTSSARTRPSLGLDVAVVESVEDACAAPVIRHAEVVQVNPRVRRELDALGHGLRLVVRARVLCKQVAVTHARPEQRAPALRLDADVELAEARLAPLVYVREVRLVMTVTDSD